MHIVRTLARRFGWDIHRFAPYNSDDARLVAMLGANGVNLVFDIGANIGQYGSLIRRFGYRGRIVSFEPLAAPHQELCRIAESDSSWTVADPVAIGAKRDLLEINVAGNSTSSSFLPMLSSHLQAAPESAYVKKESVPVAPLDEIAPQFMKPGDKAYLKIDVQGFEKSVLDGAKATLERAVGIQLEMSLVPLYDGQAAFKELYDRITALGFVPWAFMAAFSDERSGQMFQCDGVFFRP